MSEAFLRLVNMSISASWLVLAVVVLRLILKKAPKWVSVLLWGIVALRLICPFTIESALSLIPSAETISPDIMMDWTPEISTGIESLNQVVNPVISTSFAPEPSASANPLQILIPVAANLWVLGALVMLLYTVVSYISLRLKLRTAVILRNNIFQCETVHSPFVLGIIRPRIYLPYTIDGVNLYHVVAHEQAHIRRKDHWWKPLGFLLLTVYWFNPLMWVAYVLLCRDIELACDEKVIAELGNDQRADYTQALVACSVNRRRIAACPLAFGEVGVKDRVKSIMNYRKPTFWIIVTALVVCAVVAVCFLTDPVDPAENSLETDGMIMHQVSFPYATEDGYYLLIGTDGVKEIQVSLPDSGGGVVNADGSLFEKGEKVWLEHLQNVTDLRGLSITALGEDGKVLYGLSVPEDASKEDVVNVIGSDGWCLAPMSILDGVKITGKTYTYENEGIMGSFTITLYDNGTFHYYEGMASSYYGVGSWKQEGAIVTLADDEKMGYPLINTFRLDGDDLIFLEQGSSNFIYVKVKEGERFRYTGETVQTIGSASESEASIYPFRAIISEIPNQPKYFETWGPAPDPNATEPAESTYEIYNVVPLEDLPDTYTLEEATIDKCVILFDGDIRDNADVWNEFLDKTESGQSATVRIVHYYDETENSPSAMYIYDLTYDAENYELRWFEDRKEYVKNFRYLRYFYGKSENEAADYDTYISYILTDDRYATRKELLLSYASSAYGAAIPHFEVYADYIVYPDYPKIPAQLVEAELYSFDSPQNLLYAYKEEKMLARLQDFLEKAQGLGFEPKTYDIHCNLVLTGADGSTVTLGIDAVHDLFAIDGVFYDYGPGYDENGNLDATQELLNLLGLQEWPQ